MATIYGIKQITRSWENQLGTNYMPNMASGKISVAFGDFSYYWIVERQPITIKVLKELYLHNNEIGFSGYERLDGKLILKETVKLLKMA